MGIDWMPVRLPVAGWLVSLTSLRMIHPDHRTTLAAVSSSSRFGPCPRTPACLPAYVPLCPGLHLTLMSGPSPRAWDERMCIVPLAVLVCYAPWTQVRVL